VSDTAFLVAYYRALESARPDALFHDPLAAPLAGERGRELGQGFGAAAIATWNVAVRTVIIDGFIRDAVGRGIGTVLSLGAGLDTRPYRLELPPDLEWIEVDYPDVIALKQDRLGRAEPHCRLERIGLDLADRSARRNFLRRFEGHRGRLLVLTEGVVIYLTVEQAAELSDDLRALPGVDSWIIDYFSPEAHAYRERMTSSSRMQELPFKFQPDDWFGFFSAHGWRAREVRYLPEEGRQLKRPAPLPWKVRLLSRLVRFVAPAGQRARLDRFVGYVSLEPVR
jgi:methyltransferase (TIGR00027 family)